MHQNKTNVMMRSKLGKINQSVGKKTSYRNFAKKSIKNLYYNKM